jgi:hypothetical protein
MSSILDLLGIAPKGNIKLIGFERHFFDRFGQGAQIDLSQFSDREERTFTREESCGNFRIILRRIEPTLEGDYRVDVYDLRKINGPALPQNLRARNTYSDPLKAIRVYEALKRELPALN